MNAARQALFTRLLGLCFICLVSEATAAPRIEISFETADASGEELICAQAEFHRHGRETWEALASISAYPELHPWIQGARLVDQAGARRQGFLMEFKFPWPVGRRWSHIEVNRESPTRISWHQIEGNLKTNQGQLSLKSREGQVTIDYRASINVGLPNAWTRRYRKKFVVEFIGAVYDRIAAASTTNRLAIAKSSAISER